MGKKISSLQRSSVLNCSHGNPIFYTDFSSRPFEFRLFHPLFLSAALLVSDTFWLRNMKMGRVMASFVASRSNSSSKAPLRSTFIGSCGSGFTTGALAGLAEYRKKMLSQSIVTKEEAQWGNIIRTAKKHGLLSHLGRRYYARQRWKKMFLPKSQHILTWDMLARILPSPRFLEVTVS